MDQVTMERTFLDITDTVLSANQTKTYDANGYSAGTNYMTPNTIGTSATGGKVVREISSIEIYPPQDGNGNYEDLREVWPILDGHSYQHYLNLPGNGNLLMTPPRTLLRGGATLQIKLGIPLWRAVQMRIPNMPLLATCPKYMDRADLAVHSIYGTTGAGSGYRVVMKGYEYTEAALAALMSGWNNSYNLQTLRRQIEGQKALTGAFSPKGPLNFATFTSYPGGPRQGGQKINPYWHFAFNNQATPPNRVYVLSNSTTVGGGSNQVEDPEQDLAVLASSGDALWLRGWGVKAVPLPPGQTGSPGVPGENLARAGFVLDGTEVPEESGGSAGVFMTANVNPLTFGATPGEANRFDRVPAFNGELLLFGNNFAPFIGSNGSATPADLVAVGLNGVLVEQAA